MRFIAVTDKKALWTADGVAVEITSTITTSYTVSAAKTEKSWLSVAPICVISLV